MIRTIAGVGAGALLMAGAASAREGSETAVLPSVTVSHPDHWKPERRGELVTALAAQRDGETEARLRITREERRSHAEAVERLREIAAEVPQQGAFVTIGGWAALERVYLAPVPRAHGEGAAEKEMAVHATTAIAVGSDLVRFEATLAPNANPKRAEEAQEIARSARFAKEGDAPQTERDLRSLSRPATTSALEAAPARPARPLASARFFHPGTVRQVGVNGSEVEVAVSANGQNVVVASNGGTAFSTTGGAGFGPSNVNTGGIGSRGDPSVAWGPSGNFYLSIIGTPAAGAQSIPVLRSTNNGGTFTVAGQAGLCAAGSGCAPDQEHMAADRVNAAPGGGDQVYVAWRQFSNPFGGPFLSCSQDSGVNWTQGFAVDSGDFPRVAVGGNGFVYVVYRLNNNIMLHKFSSCAQGLRAQRGFPVVVAGVVDLNCPYPGLDRCETGNKLSSHTVAVDDLNPNLVFVAWGTNTRAGLDGNDNIRLRASTNGGATWGTSVVMSGAVEAKRFMPWVCATQGQAFVSWYDRRSASRTLTDAACLADCEQDWQDCMEPGSGRTPAQCNAARLSCRPRCTSTTRGASNDLTEYWSASAQLSGGALQPTAPLNHSGQPDPQCASGWPFSVDFMVDSDSCSVQPQLAGFCKGTGRPNPACLDECEQDWQDCMEPGGTRTPAQCHAARRTCRAACPTAPSSNQRCDFDMSTCPGGETCRALGGAPKYGDYNGNACVAGRAFFAWASATAPSGITSVGGIRLFFDATAPPAQLTVRKSLVPATDSGRFNLRVDGRTVAGQAGDGRSVTMAVTPGLHIVSETAAGSTVAGNYTTSFQGDCAPSGQVTLAGGDNKTCTIVNRRKPGGNGRQECLERCESQWQSCLEVAGGPDSGVTVAQCNRNHVRCQGGCPR